MPTLYAESDFTAGVFNDKQITVGAGNYGLSVTNFSDQGFQAAVQRTGETYVLPPYSLYTFPVQPNDSVIVSHLATNYNATKIGDRYVRYDQVSNAVEPRLIPLSSFPVYDQKITGDVNVLGGTVNANITSGTVTANISNASINTQLLNTFIRSSNGVVITQKNGEKNTYAVSNLKAGTIYTLEINIPTPGGAIFANKFAVLYRSAGGYSYNILFHGSFTSGGSYLDTITLDNVGQRLYNGPDIIKWYNFPLSSFDVYSLFVNPSQNVSSDTIDIFAFAVMDSVQNGVQTAGAGIYSLANNAYTTIFQASKPMIIRGLYIGTGSATVGQFRIDKNGNPGTPLLSLNTTTVSQYYPINPGYFLNPGETLQAYQTTGSALTANITIFYT